MNTIQGIYPILDAQWLEKATFLTESEEMHPDDLFSPQTFAQEVERLGIRQVQLRCKGPCKEQYDFARSWIKALRRDCPETLIIINDRVDIAMALDADGVHVGQTDLPAPICRKLLGADKIIGLSTHNKEEIEEALAVGIDYLGFGPVFGTETKADALSVRGLDALSLACRQSPIAITAIGGIGLEKIPAVVGAGASSAAMISALFGRAWRSALQEAVETWHTSER
ncbi:thiamine phosphate synthase [Magnetococcales bacterium HHB-1]